jgi:NAD(P)-dependent dehydrogenase (short-subunit alcohol dehydrogenase family)
MVSRLRRFTAGFAGIAVRRRNSLAARRTESQRSGRVYPDGPHGAKTGRPAIDAGRVGLKSNRRWADSRRLVTGASSGLGRAIAEHLVRAGARVVLTGRSADRLRRDAQALIDDGADWDWVITVPADLTVEADRRQLFAEAADAFGALDLLINNAGVGAAGLFHTHDPDVLRRVFEINVFAMAEICRAALPSLAQGHQATRVNMGSIVARRGLPGRTEYAARKFAVTSLTEALRIEWRRFGIDVLQINPGFTRQCSGFCNPVRLAWSGRRAELARTRRRPRRRVAAHDILNGVTGNCGRPGTRRC